MVLQALLLILVWVILPLQARAECFDFSHKVEKKLESPSPLPPPKPNAIVQKSGTTKDGAVWAEVKGDVDRPLHEVLDDLEKHRATKSDRVSDMHVDVISRTPDWVHQKVHYEVKPFLFVTVDWTEDWSFSSQLNHDGNIPEATVAYEKTSGTTYIQHLCGEIRLRRKTPDQTQVSIYEEVKATQRSRQDTLSGVRSTLRKLALASPEK